MNKMEDDEMGDEELSDEEIRALSEGLCLHCFTREWGHVHYCWPLTHFFQ